MQDSERQVIENQPTHRSGGGLAGIAVRFPVTISMLFIGIILLGYVSLTNLPTSLFPDLRTPRITITADAPGLSPREVERVVIEHFEGSLSTLSDVEQVTSIARADTGVIQVDFAWGSDMDYALLDVKKAVGGANIEELSEQPSSPPLRSQRYSDCYPRPLRRQYVSGISLFIGLPNGRSGPGAFTGCCASPFNWRCDSRSSLPVGCRSGQFLWFFHERDSAGHRSSQWSPPREVG